MPLEFRRLKANYSTTSGPPGFQIDYKHNRRTRDFADARAARELGTVGRINTCAVRLSDAITRIDPGFFRDVSAGFQWREPRRGGRRLPINAGKLATALRQKIGEPEHVGNQSEIEGRTGIIFFDTIAGYPGVSGHISLWESVVVDGGDYFPGSPMGTSPRVYFWEVPSDGNTVQGDQEGS